MGNNIFEVMERNKFSYKSIREKSIVSLLDEKEYTINILIGFRGRPQFWNAITESFEQAFKYYNEKFPEREHKFCLTFVEHSEKQTGQSFFKNRVNYLWTPGNVVEQYSRSFAYNFGFLYSNKAKFYIFHDLDIVVQKDFCVLLFENLGDARFMQTYGKRRVLYMSESLMEKVIKKEIDYNTFSEETPGISPPKMYGSKGGSVLVERELCIESGLFCPELFFGYAIEDQFMFDVVLTIYGEPTYADDPCLNIYHLYHTPSHSSNPLCWEMDGYYHQFRDMTKPGRMKFIEMQRNNLQDK